MKAINLKQYLKAMGVNQQTIAYWLGINRSTVSIRLADTKNAFSVGDLLIIARKLNVDPQEVFAVVANEK